MVKERSPGAVFTRYRSARSSPPAVRHGEYASIQALCADRQDSLAQLIGAQGSLQEALRQCKAAISHPAQVCRCCCGALLAPGKVFSSPALALRNR